MCLADDHTLNIYYTDTDSIHIDEAGVEPLAKLYKEKYGRELVGNQPGKIFIATLIFRGCPMLKASA